MYSYNPEHPCANSCGKVSEHVYIMYHAIGRLLTKDECVHHKDGNKINNVMSNLQLMTISEHTRFHQLEKSKDWKTIICPICSIHEDVPGNSKRKYCSIACKNLGANKISITKEELQKLVWEKPIMKIAEDYDVSGTAIRKHCTKFKIELPPIGHWIKKIKTPIKTGFLF